jgi:hypothetical protein
LEITMTIATVRAGFWLTLKARHQAQDSGYYVAAKNLRKQGVPFIVARAILLGK